MSDHFVTIVPSEPRHLPSRESVASLEFVVRALAPGLDRIAQHQHSGVRFFDAGSNFESVACPYCKQALGMNWWGRICEADFAGEFFQLATHALPCCGKPATLNELTYDWPQAFGRFGLEVMNPGRGSFDSDELATIQAALGCPVKIVYRHL